METKKHTYNFIDLTGKRFGRWLVLKFVGKNKYKNAVWLCRCDCGTEREVTGISLRAGQSKSCGCYLKELGRKRIGESNPSWKGGEYINDAGYVMKYLPDHPRATSNGYVREHIIISERALGKPIPKNAQIHHYGEVGDNSKLVICQDQQYHFLLHMRTRALRACGNANYRKCKFCGKYDDPKNMYCKQDTNGNGWNIYHRECSREYDRRRYAAKKVSA